GLRPALSARSVAKSQKAHRGGVMTEDGNGSVVPFPLADAGGEAGDVVETHAHNPAERLHMAEAVRMAEAIVFASAEPVSEKQIGQRLPEGIDVPAVMAELQQIYERRGVNLVRVGDAW